MAIAKTILFSDNRAHSSVNTSQIIAADSTAEGNMHAVRDSNYLTYWKGADSGGTNGSLVLDLGTTGQLGIAGATAYWCIAYDARLSDHEFIYLQVNTNDDTDFTDESGVTSVTISPTHLPTCQWVGFTVPTPAKRYYRLKLSIADGTIRPRIFYWGLFAESGLIKIDDDYGKMGPGTGRYDFGSNAGRMFGPAGAVDAVRLGQATQSFDLSVPAAKPTLWTATRDALHGANLSGKAFFVQYEGLKNDAQANFQLCRVDADNWNVPRSAIEKYEIRVPFLTETFV